MAVRSVAFARKQDGIQLYVFGGVQDFSQRTCDQVMRMCEALLEWISFLTR